MFIYKLFMWFKYGGILMKRILFYIVCLVATVQLSVFTYNQIIKSAPALNRAVFGKYTDVSKVESVLPVVKGFIELDASFNTSDAIDRIDEAKKYLTESCFESLYLNNGKFMDLPDESIKPVLRFIDSATELTDSGYKVIIIWSEDYDSRIYTYTGILKLDNSYKIDSFRKIPHLK